jgi:hypothetical protein
LDDVRSLESVVPKYRTPKRPQLVVMPVPFMVPYEFWRCLVG